MVCMRIIRRLGCTQLHCNSQSGRCVICAQSAAGRCNVYSTVVGDSAHPEGFCQKTCNRCNEYCVPKNGRAAPSRPSSSSSSSSGGKTPSSSSCSDNPPDRQYSCAQQVQGHHSIWEASYIMQKSRDMINPDMHYLCSETFGTCLQACLMHTSHAAKQTNSKQIQHK